MLERWFTPPVVITLVLLVVVLVNVAFATIAISGADTVDPTYSAPGAR